MFLQLRWSYTEGQEIYNRLPCTHGLSCSPKIPKVLFVLYGLLVTPAFAGVAALATVSTTRVKPYQAKLTIISRFSVHCFEPVSISFVEHFGSILQTKDFSSTCELVSRIYKPVL